MRRAPFALLAFVVASTWACDSDSTAIAPAPVSPFVGPYTLSGVVTQLTRAGMKPYAGAFVVWGCYGVPTCNFQGKAAKTDQRGAYIMSGIYLPKGVSPTGRVWVQPPDIDGHLDVADPAVCKGCVRDLTLTHDTHMDFQLVLP